MINPVTGGAASEPEIRAHLHQLRGLAESYNSLDRETGGLYRLGQSIQQLEKVLGEGDFLPADAEFIFLQRNATVKWNTGVPTWEHWQIVGDDWRVTTWEVTVSLANPRSRLVTQSNY